MRISDWISYVCSSDLDLRDHPLRQQTLLPEGFNALHQPVERHHRAHGDKDERLLLRPASAQHLKRIADFGMGPSALQRLRLDDDLGCKAVDRKSTRLNSSH